MKCLMNEANQLGLTSWSDKLAYLIAEGQTAVQEKTECPVRHYFEPGVYIRQMTIPAGTWFIGRPHKAGHLCRLVTGSLKLITEQGSILKHSGDEMTTAPGYMTVLYALSDVEAWTYHPNPDERRDTENMEEEIFESLPSIIARVEVMKRNALEKAA